MSTGERWGRRRGRRQGRAWQGTAGAMDQACKAAGATSRGSCRGRRRSAIEARKVLTGKQVGLGKAWTISVMTREYWLTGCWSSARGGLYWMFIPTACSFRPAMKQGAVCMCSHGSAGGRKKKEASAQPPYLPPSLNMAPPRPAEMTIVWLRSIVRSPYSTVNVLPLFAHLT